MRFLGLVLVGLVFVFSVFGGEDETCEPNLVGGFMRVGHYQCVCRLGDFEANLKTVKKGLESACEAGLEIVSFPESFLTGYFFNEPLARRNCFSIDSEQVKRLLKETAKFDVMYMVGFNELRDGKLFNTVLVAEKGKLIGRYSKAFPCFGYFEPGRDFPVFEKNGLKFGVIICADGAYVEPARILAVKGARFIFAPHFNFVTRPLLHAQIVKGDHIARAVENRVYFLRGNSVTKGKKLVGSGFDEDGFGYGDSYVINPEGKVVAGAGYYKEGLMIYNLDISDEYLRGEVRGLKSTKALGEVLSEAVREMEE